MEWLTTTPTPTPRRGAHPSGLGLHPYSSCTPETGPATCPLQASVSPSAKGRAFLCTEFLWMLGPMSGHKRLVVGSKGTKRLRPASRGWPVKEAGFEPGSGFPRRPTASRRETVTVHRGRGKSDASRQNGPVEVALSLGPLWALCQRAHGVGELLSCK